MRGNLKRSSGSSPLRRILIYGGLVLFLGCAQCAFFPLLSVCPATPDLMLGLILAVALLDSDRSAAVVAVSSGVFIDAVGGAGLSLSPVIYLIFVMLIGTFSRKVLKSFASYLLLLLPSLLYRALATYICLALADRALPALWVIGEVLLPEALTTGLLCLPIYIIVKLFSGLLENHSRFSF